MAQMEEIGILRTRGTDKGRRKKTKVSVPTIRRLPLPSTPRDLRILIFLLSSFTDDSVFTDKMAKEREMDTVEMNSIAMIKTPAVLSDSYFAASLLHTVSPFSFTPYS